jgi:hypothetical protein
MFSLVVYVWRMRRKRVDHPWNNTHHFPIVWRTVNVVLSIFNPFNPDIFLRSTQTRRQYVNLSLLHSIVTLSYVWNFASLLVDIKKVKTCYCKKNHVWWTYWIWMTELSWWWGCKKFQIFVSRKYRSVKWPGPLPSITEGKWFEAHMGIIFCSVLLSFPLAA